MRSSQQVRPVVLLSCSLLRYMLTRTRKLLFWLFALAAKPNVRVAVRFLRDALR